MAKLIFLKIRRNFQEGKGFDVTIQISRGEGEPFSTGIDYQLPQISADIPASYDKLRENYSYLRRYLSYPNRQRLGVQLSSSEQCFAQLTENCRSSYKNLTKELKSWLSQYEHIEYRNLKERLIQELGDSQGRGEEVRFFIQTNDDLLNRLPWHQWDIFTISKTKCEVAISPSNFDQVQKVKISPKSTMRILAILGDSTGLNLEAERAYLEESFQGAEVCFISEPTREVISDRLGYEDWDILFFAGHSDSENAKGKIYTRTNPKEYLTIENLKPGLRDAIERGLKLAIFNSCDGLQLAYDLAELHIPQLIVMREPVPDKVAQSFLKHFLKAFSEKQESLYQAVRKARIMLQTEGLEDEFPGAAWMPVICQNPAEPSLVWSTPISQEDAKNQLLTEIRQKFSVAKLTRDIQICFDEVENFLSQYPQDVEGRLLKSDIEQALLRKKTTASWKEKTWKCRYTLTNHTDIIKSIAIHPNGQIFASCSLDRTIKIWNINTGQLLHNISAHSSGITCVTFSNDGNILASSSAYPNATIKLWDTKTWQVKRTLRADDWVVLSIWSIAMSADGKTLVSGHHADSTVKVWNAETGQLRHTLRGHVWAVHSVAIAPDGQTIASASFDSNIKIWNANTGRQLRNLNGPGEGPVGWTRSFFSDNSVYSVAFSPDGTTLASGGAKQPIKLWSLSSGETKSTLSGHTDEVLTVAFSPDGKYLASGSSDRTIRIWDLSQAEPVYTLGHADTVQTLAFSPDGSTLISGGRDRTIKIWHLSA